MTGTRTVTMTDREIAALASSIMYTRCVVSVLTKGDNAFLNAAPVNMTVVNEILGAFLERVEAMPPAFALPAGELQTGDRQQHKENDHESGSKDQ